MNFYLNVSRDGVAANVTNVRHKQELCITLLLNKSNGLCMMSWRN